jgi:hypothetical protein
LHTQNNTLNPNTQYSNFTKIRKAIEVLSSWAKAWKEKELGVTGVTLVWQNQKERY